MATVFTSDITQTIRAIENTLADGQPDESKKNPVVHGFHRERVTHGRRPGEMFVTELSAIRILYLDDNGTHTGEEDFLKGRVVLRVKEEYLWDVVEVHLENNL